MFSVSLWKESQLLQILNDLSIKHLIKRILYENDVKLVTCRLICDLFEEWDFDYRYLKCINQGKRWHVDDILAAFEKKQDSLKLLGFLNNTHPNIKFMIEKQVNHTIN